MILNYQVWISWLKYHGKDTGNSCVITGKVLLFLLIIMFTWKHFFSFIDVTVLYI